MTRVLLATSSTELVDRFTRALGEGLIALWTGRLPEEAATLLAAAPTGAPPQVVVLDAAEEPTAVLVLAAELGQQPGVSVVLVGEQDAEATLAALRAGVRDLLPPTAEGAEITLAVEAAGRSAALRVPSVAATADPAAEPLPGARGRVISVVSPKGGVGKTTVATNLAVGLAQHQPGSTVLVDLDIQFGDVASALDLEPEHYLPDAVSGPARQDSMALKTVLTRHRTGLHVICAPDSPADADAVTEADVAALLQVLAAEFRYVVVDTAPGLSEHTLAALDQTTDLVLLTSMDVPGVRGMRKELDTLSRLDLLPTARHLVLNFTDRRSLLTVADVEFTIGTGVDLQLPRSKAAPDSVDQGVPLLQSGARDPMTTQLRQLLTRVLGQDAAAAGPGAVTKGRTPPRRAASRWRRTRTAAA